jgi:hypothetical protein
VRIYTLSSEINAAGWISGSCIWQYFIVKKISVVPLTILVIGNGGD